MKLWENIAVSRHLVQWDIAQTRHGETIKQKAVLFQLCYQLCSKQPQCFSWRRYWRTISKWELVFQMVSQEDSKPPTLTYRPNQAPLTLTTTGTSTDMNQTDKITTPPPQTVHRFKYQHNTMAQVPFWTLHPALHWEKVVKEVLPKQGSTQRAQNMCQPGTSGFPCTLQHITKKH